MGGKYEAVLEAIKAANEAASRLGWQGYELQAHVFCAAVAAANGEEPVIDPAPVSDTEKQETVE